jgi:hypothetical protein
MVGGKAYADLVRLWGEEGVGVTVSIGRVCVLPFSTRQAIGGESWFGSCFVRVVSFLFPCCNHYSSILIAKR